MEAGDNAGSGVRLAVPDLYVRYAAGFLILTVLAGAWLRAALLWPVTGPFTFGNLVHAHSHVAFFGWATMALFGLLTRGGPTHEAGRALRRHAHVVGAASLAAFVSFALGGYTLPSIIIATLHVAAWVVFALLIRFRVPGHGRRTVRAYYRTALVWLVVAGAGAMAPGIAMARGVTDPWWNAFVVKLFLVPFMAGWLAVGAMGAVYEGLRDARYARVVLRLIAVGVLPSTVLFVAPPAPWPAMMLIGRLGVGFVAAGTVLFAVDVLRARRDVPLLLIAGLAALVKGTAEALAALGVGASLLHSRHLVVAYLHLSLLGFITAALLASILPRGSRAAAPAALFASGLAVMLAALLLLGWPAAFRLASQAGLSAPGLLAVAFAGAVAVAAGTLLLVRPLLRCLPSRPGIPPLVGPGVRS